MSKKLKIDTNLIFVFKYPQLKVDVNPEIYGKIKNLIEQEVKMLSREIYIDKTYVDYKGTKYKKTFIYEEGWNKLCKLLKITNYGKNSTKEQHILIQLAYEKMIIEYSYQFLEDIGYDIANIEIEFEKNSQFIVEIIHDIIQNDIYKGKWQDW